jgi:hypothetical protein
LQIRVAGQMNDAIDFRGIRGSPSDGAIVVDAVNQY